VGPGAPGAGPHFFGRALKRTQLPVDRPGVVARALRDTRPDFALALLLCLLALGAHGVNLRLESFERATRPPGEVGPLPDGRALRVLSLGFERLVADVFWLRTTYYVGDEEVEEAGFPDAGRLAELVTDVDPHFTSAYVIMQSVLAVLRRDPDAALALLEKGLRHNPDHWRMHFLRGFMLFFDKGEYAPAAEHIRRASELGGPPYLQLLATRLYTQAGSPETALAFVETRLAGERDPKVRARLAVRRHDLVVERDLARIDAAVERFRAQTGRAPRDLGDLVARRLLPGVPLDPDGHPYFLERGRAAARAHFERLEVYRQGALK
jgi:tetratricopeptide (TPR) repeat protein